MKAGKAGEWEEIEEVGQQQRWPGGLFLQYFVKCYKMIWYDTLYPYQKGSYTKNTENQYTIDVLA